MDNVRSASQPDLSATVMASAGTGKTWLLVTRAVRLLLEGTAPDAILAVTFTRKAAAEMAERLMQRLAELAGADEAGRRALLGAMGITPDAALLRCAADLYERQLRQPRQIRFTTFHAFCQELLRRFPLEAEVPAGFDVLESPGLLQQQAWDALLAEATAAPDGATAAALAALFEQCSSLPTVRSALRQFLDHRSDWWAYIGDEPAPVRYACERLADALGVDSAADPFATVFSISAQQELREYAELLNRHGTSTFAECVRAIGDALHGQGAAAARYVRLKCAFLTKEGEPFARKASKAMEKTLGAAGQTRLLELHTRWAERLLDVQDSLNRRATLQLTGAWLAAGTRLLDHYQRLKAEQRELDFADLEWKAYRLMNRSDHALWVQYKLDQRIDHILVDEFQDTNPTQWHLLFPLLQELAAGAAERLRSVFLVGDTKQSIYRFRRADPELFPAAKEWLSERLDAGAHTLAASWRSAPAVIEFVNRVFGTGPLRDALAEFPLHSTQRGALWGAVEVLPLVVGTDAEPAAVANEMRNPLMQPRLIRRDQRHLDEGRAIAAGIQALMSDGTAVADGGAARPLRYDDVMILVRQRTHLAAYEQALRAAGIPYLSANRGTLLHCIEIQDMVNLLETLIVPYNNLALAAVLRSPLFACSDADLIALAREPVQGGWFERLLDVGARRVTGSPLARAAVCLARWQRLAGQRPVHDLLDRIYAEGNVLARFDAAFPAHLRPRVRANLTRFIELALEVDSGRYPSLSAFLHRLRTVESSDDDAPDEAPVAAAEGGVRILTVHAAKGLEAPVVFLADAAAGKRAGRAYQPLVRWPTLAAAPSHFLLTGKASELDRVSAALLDEQQRAEQREQANLLYVAVTRAKQYLFISGCQPQRGEGLGWYGLIAAQLGDVDTVCTQGWREQQGTAPPLMAARATGRADTAPVDPRLGAPLVVTPYDVEIAPSRGIEHDAPKDGDEDGRERGRAIHRFLELLCSKAPCGAAETQRRVAAELGLDAADARLAAWWQGATAVFNEPTLKSLFDPLQFDAAYDEVPIHYQRGDVVVYGVIDRMILRGERCVVIDYKTHRGAAERPEIYAALFHEQLRLYAEGAARLWPGKQVEAYLLFTVSQRLYACS